MTIKPPRFFYISLISWSLRFMRRSAIMLLLFTKMRWFWHRFWFTVATWLRALALRAIPHGRWRSVTSSQRNATPAAAVATQLPTPRLISLAPCLLRARSVDPHHLNLNAPCGIMSLWFVCKTARRHRSVVAALRRRNASCGTPLTRGTVGRCLFPTFLCTVLCVAVCTSTVSYKKIIGYLCEHTI